jgi:hypothetical protein
LIDKVQKTDGYTAGMGRMHKNIRKNCAKRAPVPGRAKNGSSCADFQGKTGKPGTFRGKDVKIFFRQK